MLQTTFIQYVSKFWASLVLSYTNLVNGKKTALTYLHKEMLTKAYSTSLKWETLLSENDNVVADVISLDSSTPLKRRNSLGKVTGEIYKIGMKKQMTESLMTQINTMRAQGIQESAVTNMIFKDSMDCQTGIYEQHEKMFQEALSTGVMTVTNPENVGIGVRVDMGVPADNQYGVGFAWSDPTTSTPIDDISNVVDNATMKGDSIQYIMMNRITFNQFINSAQVRGAFAGSQGFTGSNLPVLSLEQANSVLSARFLGLTLRVVDRTVITERNGERTIVRPWASNKVTFLTTMQVGRLVWTNLAETLNQNKAVSYVVADDYILLKKWHSNEPYAELTSSQSLSLPVLDNPTSIYIMDVSDAEGDEQTEGDSTITIFGDSTVTVENLVSALNSIGKDANAEMTDAQLLSIVNKLSNKDEAKLRVALEIPTVSAGNDDTASSNPYVLVGTATASDGKTIVSTIWTKTSGASVTMATPTALSNSVTGLATGVYVFKLTVTDSAGVVTSDSVTITATI